MDLNHGSTGYEPVGISGRPAAPAAFLTTLPRCAAAMHGSVYERAARAPGTGRPAVLRNGDRGPVQRFGFWYNPTTFPSESWKYPENPIEPSPIGCLRDRILPPCFSIVASVAVMSSTTIVTTG